MLVRQVVIFDSCVKASEMQDQAARPLPTLIIAAVPADLMDLMLLKRCSRMLLRAVRNIFVL
jgi:hypothetical protein